MPSTNTIRVHVPLTLRKRGSRPRILPPKDMEAATPTGQDPRLRRAIGRAWRWRKMLEAGEVATLADLATEQGLSDRYVSRLLRLAWLAPEVLERLVVCREPCAITIYDLCLIASLPWEEQVETVFA
ncbi:putative phage-related protein [Ruegeria lacuscaerulensis ITI-1157]|nr:putative phage-related protein [Ruegeria lacuscaerulensis ITI-1157]SHI63027.1 hypothetical protein SAMN05444404_0668 [Ruegeria lacuscaerulensis ITI-1157]